MNIRHLQSGDLSIPLVKRILLLKNTVWPSDREIEEQCNDYMQFDKKRPNRRILVLEDEQGDLLGHADLFTRQIYCGDSGMTVGCLAGVCILSQKRGKGLGRRLVREAFNTVNHHNYAVILFQTAVPEFYRKLGARVIENTFINSQSKVPETNPWQDDYIMIYPDSFPWPKGGIDLNGSDF